jgi:hypothetical protein
MTIEIATHVVDDIPGFVARGNREVIAILPRRGLGKNVRDTVLSVPAVEVVPQMTVQTLEEFSIAGLTGCLNRLDANGYDIFEVVPHRHGQTVKLSVYGVRPRRQPPATWLVQTFSDYETELVAGLVALNQAGYAVHTLMPFREGANNFPVVIACSTTA